MSRFAPTLRLDINAEQIAAVEATGMTFDDMVQQTKEFFKQVDVKDKPTFNAERITDIETGLILSDYNTTVVGKFSIDGMMFLKTALGDIIAVEFHRI